MLFYYVAAYLSAFLLFLIQPMLTKGLLPSFGGSYLVWGAAMVFFQSALLLGYAMSHVLQATCGVRRYGRLHLLLLLVPLLLFSFRFSQGNPDLEQNLAFGVFQELALVAGIPFLILSMTSLILQRWLMVSTLPERGNPYVLYAASNAGSVSALLAYPVLIEPVSTLEQQGVAWWIGYLLLVLLHWKLFPWRCSAEQNPISIGAANVSWRQRMFWFWLSLATGTVLLATTNVITFDLAAIPMLWVLPLTLFMLAYVVVFKREMWSPVWMRRLLNWCAILGACLVLLMRLRIMLPPVVMLLLHLIILFVFCVNCNTWLRRTAPSGGKGVTEFYVILALGGVCGSLLVSWILPLVTHSLLEYPLGIFLVLFSIGCVSQTSLTRSANLHSLCGVGVFGLFVVLLPSCMPANTPESVVFALIALPLALGLRAGKAYRWIPSLLILLLMWGAGALDQFASGGEIVARLRNYYGIYHIYDRDGIRYLQHGTTQHGSQHLDTERSMIPRAYYHPTTPVARLLMTEPSPFEDIGMIGLGTGAFAAYAKDGQQWSIFELDPDNLLLAETHFRYLAQARAQGAGLRFVFGDGRLRLAQEPLESFDLIIMDAFNSGSIPVHLLTVEALAMYQERLRPDGIIVLHVSNRVLDLIPILHANAEAIGLYALYHSNASNVHADAEMTIWVAVGANRERMRHLQDHYGWQAASSVRLPRPWTDRYSNLPAAIRWL